MAGSNEYDLTSNHFILLAGGTYNGPQQISYHLGTKVIPVWNSYGLPITKKGGKASTLVAKLGAIYWGFVNL